MTKKNFNAELSENDFNKLMDKLKNKIHKITSKDGFVTLEYNGLGEFISLKFNIDLKDADKETIEEDTINLFQSTKNQVSTDFVSLMSEIGEAMQNEVDENRDEDGYEVRRDVS